MAKKQNKPVKEETLETILFNCRNSLRGRAAMTDKRDLLLTLVFLKFIGERFKQQKEKIRHEIVEVQGINDTDFIELQLSRPNQYMQDGVFFLTDETFWDELILTSPRLAFVKVPTVGFEYTSVTSFLLYPKFKLVVQRNWSVSILIVLIENSTPLFFIAAQLTETVLKPVTWDTSFVPNKSTPFL